LFTFLIVFCGYSATLISQLASAPAVTVPFKDLQEFIRKSNGWKAGPIRGDLTQIYMEVYLIFLITQQVASQFQMV
jgi:hypothetical protein